MTVVGRLSADKKRLSALEQGVLVYAGSKEQLAFATTIAAQHDPKRREGTFMLLLVGALMLLGSVAWMRFKATA